MAFLTLVILVFSIFQTPATARGTKHWIGRLIPKNDTFSWEGCPDIKPEDFSQVTVVDFKKHKVRGPVHVTFNKTSSDPNFYFIERTAGMVRYYTDFTGEVQDVGDVKYELHIGKLEDGLNGIALDYDFDTNRWIYLFYSIEGFFRIARFWVSEDNTFQKETQQVLLDVPKIDRQWHASGKMDFDAYGNLWISIGDNLRGYLDDKFYVSMATADLRGSWLRIHPTKEKQANGKYYTIPEDNFGEYWAKKFEAQGKSEAAADYRNPEIVLPEIFSKGVRNSWGLKVVQPFTPVVASGECGPDHPKPDGFTEQTNVVSKPGFHGWPIHMGIVDWKFFYGTQVKSLPGGTVYDSLGPQIVDNDLVKGARLLPPIVTPVYKWEYRGKASPEKSRSCGTGAAVYWYDAYSKSDRKFPPHLNGRLFATDHAAQWLRVVTLNETMDTALSESEFFNPNKNIEYESPLDVTFGPDGALYVIHNPSFGNSSKARITRIDYTGSCRPDTVLTPFRGCMDPKAGNYDPRVKYGCPDNICCEPPSSVKPPDERTLFNIGVRKARLLVNIKAPGQHAFRIFNVHGKLIASKGVQGAGKYYSPELLRGIYFIKLNLDNREYTQRALVYY